MNAASLVSWVLALALAPPAPPASVGAPQTPETIDAAGAGTTDAPDSPIPPSQAPAETVADPKPAPAASPRPITQADAQPPAPQPGWDPPQEPAPQPGWDPPPPPHPVQTTPSSQRADVEARASDDTRKRRAGIGLLAAGVTLVPLGAMSMLFVAAPAGIAKRVYMGRAEHGDRSLRSRDQLYRRARVADDVMEGAFWAGAAMVVVGIPMIVAGAVLKRQARSSARVSAAPNGIRVRF